MSDHEKQEQPKSPVQDTAMTMVPPEGKNFATEMTMVEQPRSGTDVTMLQDKPAAEPRTVVAALQPGDRVDRYVVVKQLGQGGMGSVYLVRHETLGVFRAIKVLSHGLYTGKGGEFIRRFVQEARIACSINNPNIVNVLDVHDDTEKGFCYIIMEYVDGGTVRDVLRSIPHLNEAHAIAITEAVAVALCAAAEQKIVHRDIKPDNIMFTRRGEVKLADLGIAKSNEENVQLTKSHVMMGTPAYLSPEQARDARAVDVRADVYSLGATLYEMLTGQIPYPGKNTFDILTKLSSDPVPDPRSIVNTVSPQTARLVMKMLAKQAKQRHRDADELLRDIRNLGILPSDFDSQKSIRELLEQSGAGNYSCTRLTPTAGNSIPARFIKNLLFMLAGIRGKIKVFSVSQMIAQVRSNAILFYSVIVLATLLLIGIPMTVLLSAGGKPKAHAPPPMITETKPETEIQPVETPEPEKPALIIAPVTPPPEKPETKIQPVEPPKPDKPVLQIVPVTPTPKPEPKPVQVEPKKPVVQPKTPPPLPVAKKVTVSGEVSPVGAVAVLLDGRNLEVEKLLVSDSGKIQFNVLPGQYKLRLNSPGFEPNERSLTVSGDKEVTFGKVNLIPQLLAYTLNFYGDSKLLDYLKENGLELKIDDEDWRTIKEFPHKVELSRAMHRIAVRAKSIQPVAERQIPAGNEKSTVDFYLREKDAALEITSDREADISINISGGWEPLRKSITIAPFQKYSLKWKTATGQEGDITIPELLPGASHKVEIAVSLANAAENPEYAEAIQFMKDGEYKKAIEKLRIVEEKGHAQAAYLLGEMAEKGQGRWFSSDSEAREWYEKSANEPINNGRAQYKMGVFYEEGRGGLDSNLSTAIGWYKKSAAQRNPEAQYRMAMILKNGEGGEAVDFPRMIKYLQAAAEAGHAEAQYQLGYCYENGIGIPVNVLSAKRWYEKSAAQGNKNAVRRGKALEGLK